jgi:hypothetical protein
MPALFCSFCCALHAASNNNSQQERLEQQLEKFLVRRQPLGNDRYNRLYWWGLAGNKEGLLLQQEVGCADTMLSLLQEAAAEAAEAAAAAKLKAELDPTSSAAADAEDAQDDAAASNQDSKQSAGGVQLRRVSVAEAGVGQELTAPLDHKGLLLPAGPEGWAVIDDVALLEGLAGGLEQRGVREKELKASLEKVRLWSLWFSKVDMATDVSVNMARICVCGSQAGKCAGFVCLMCGTLYVPVLSVCAFVLCCVGRRAGLSQCVIDDVALLEGLIFVLRCCSICFAAADAAVHLYCHCQGSSSQGSSGCKGSSRGSAQRWRQRRQARQEEGEGYSSCHPSRAAFEACPVSCCGADQEDGQRCCCCQ